MAYGDGIARGNIETFYQPVVMPGGWLFDHATTLQTIDLYYNSQFQTGSYDGAGFYKYFYNITKPACLIASKFIDLDRKDLNLVSTRPGMERRLWIMRRDFANWMRHHKFAQTMNQLRDDFPKYGHALTKRHGKGEVSRVPVPNMRMLPSSPTLRESPFVYELIDMTRSGMRAMKNWDQGEIDELFARRPQDSVFTVYECYDQNDGLQTKPWHRSIRADLFRVDPNKKNKSAPAKLGDRGDYLSSCILFEDDVADLPYEEEKWENCDGRWLGFGFSEDLFNPQIRRNELVNVRAKAMYFTSLHLYQSTDDVPYRNVTEDAENGDILTVRSNITPLATEERNLAVFREEAVDWDTNAERQTFSFDAARGDDLPSNTPLGVAQLSAGMVASFFAMKREKLGLFIAEIVKNQILPQFKEQKFDQHAIKFAVSDEDIGTYYREAARALASKQVIASILDKGSMPTEGAYKAAVAKAEETLKRRGDGWMDVPEAFYNDIDSDVDVDPTGEQMNVGALGQTLMTAMTVIAQNPNVVSDPRLRAFMFRMLELSGVSPGDLRLLGEEVDRMPDNPAMAAGTPGSAPMMPGGMSAPSAQPAVMAAAR